ncbi:MAG: TetR/AcrR family transcriptional regulator [Rhodospirillales bacterium]|nr:TetR/AcrR family transcriptional regulator [Rhodospirillales bacterium]
MCDGKSDFVRARSADQIELRRTKILNATANLIMEEGIDNISLNGIARRAGISKSNLYRYFTGKEEIVFEVMTEDYTNWFEDIKTKLRALPAEADDRAIAHALSETLRGKERLCTFMSLKALIIERNMSPEIIERFSNNLKEKANKVLEVLLSQLEGVDHSQGPFILYATHAAIAGLWPMAQHPKSEEDDQWQSDFHRDLENMVLGVIIVARAN